VHIKNHYLPSSGLAATPAILPFADSLAAAAVHIPIPVV
jgi:hypothetical protein